MAQKTTKNNPTMTAKNFVEKLPSSTDSADNNSVSSDVDNCTNNYRRSGKKMLKKHRKNLSKLKKHY